MKNLIILLVLLFFVSFPGIEAKAQLGGLLNKVKNKVADKVLGNQSSSQDDPVCACQDAVMILNLTDNIKIDYKEAVFSALEDGTILVLNKHENKYYLVKEGKLDGPYEENSPVVRQFENRGDDSENHNNRIEDLLIRYKGFIVPSGDQYSIVFGGKTYGPYALIQDFVLNHSRTQFAAIVIKDVIMTESQGKKMEQAMEKAKSDQERMQIAMQMSQQMQEKMASGGTIDITPKIVSNVPEAVYDIATMGAVNLSSKVKYDEIVFAGYGKIMDLTGKVLTSVDPQYSSSSGNFWLSSDNSRFASFGYGTIKFSDGKQLADLFCPYLTKQNGKLFISYMYFSPKNNAIMQCKLPF